MTEHVKPQPEDKPHIKMGIMVTPHFITNFATSPDGDNLYVRGLAEFVQGVLDQTVDKLMSVAQELLSTTDVELLPPSAQDSITALEMVMTRMRTDPSERFVMSGLGEKDAEGSIVRVDTNPTPQQYREVFGDREGGGTSKPS